MINLDYIDYDMKDPLFHLNTRRNLLEKQLKRINHKHNTMTAKKQIEINIENNTAILEKMQVVFPELFI